MYTVRFSSYFSVTFNDPFLKAFSESLSYKEIYSGSSIGCYSHLLVMVLIAPKCMLTKSFCFDILETTSSLINFHATNVLEKYGKVANSSLKTKPQGCRQLLMHKVNILNTSHYLKHL